MITAGSPFRVTLGGSDVPSYYREHGGLRSRVALDRGETALFGELMHEHREHKKRCSGGISNPQDEPYELKPDDGATGGVPPRRDEGRVRPLMAQRLAARQCHLCVSCS